MRTVPKYLKVLSLLASLAAGLLIAAVAQAATTYQVDVNPNGGNNDLRTTLQIDAGADGVPIGDAERITQALPADFVNQLRSFGNCPVNRFDNNEGPTTANCPDRSSIVGTGQLVLHGTGQGTTTSDAAFIVKSNTGQLNLWWHFTGAGGVETSGVAPGNVSSESAPFGPAISYNFSEVPSGLRVRQLSLNYLRGSQGVAPFAAARCSTGNWRFQARINYAGAVPDQAVDANVACGAASVIPQPSKLELARATIFREDRLIDVLAPITSRASGDVAFELHAAGQRFRWSSPIDSDDARLRFRKRIPAAQANLRTGILTMRYPGDADTRPQVVRLRAANNAARLSANRPRIENGRLVASGRITGSARGVVRIQLEYFSGGRTTTLERNARIENGRWNLNAELTAEQQAAIANRAGPVHSYILFTGYFPRRIRGEMDSFQVLP